VSSLLSSPLLFSSLLSSSFLTLRKLDGLWGVCYICLTFLLGNIIIMTVFVSILLQEFDARREQRGLRRQFEEDRQVVVVVVVVVAIEVAVVS
jgi:hypothetical protein